ncbi:hypothetical protein [Halobellus litoreus]|uniref:Uncharacterized protein n=1 Tax=Halobellus litoreus TaxID=755310 RepID=A0ABD6DYL3_9EURY|nr:hypothetical protein [Halobellus litoreus]
MNCEKCGRGAVEVIRERRFLLFNEEDPVYEYGFCSKHWPDSDEGVRELMRDICSGEFDHECRYEMLRESVEQRPAIYLETPVSLDYEWLSDDEREDLQELAREVLAGDSE